MTVWPSLAARWDGRQLARWIYSIGLGKGLLPFNLTVGKLLAFATAPAILPLYFLTVIPGIGIPGLFWIKNSHCKRYRLTNRRVIVEYALGAAEERALALDRFDSIAVEVLPGQEWYHAGDLIFRLGETETFRLAGVPRPEAFRQTCLKAHHSYVGVDQARAAGVAS